jgi:DNA-binding CsgD family transcriptional regulator
MPRTNPALVRAAAAGTRWGGRAPAGRREHRVRFWQAIARGASSEKAAVEAGVLPNIGVRWFRKGGGMSPLSFAPPSGRYLSFTEREEIAVLLVGGFGVREIARRLGRAPSTISRELQRNAAIGRSRVEYRASTAQRHAERRAQRPKAAKLAVNPELRSYVQDRLSGRCNGLMGASRVQISPGGGGVRDRGRIAAGDSAGARSRSPVVCAWTSPMMSRCACLMRRSISRSISRAAERCAGS